MQKIFVCLPILNEAENLPALLEALNKQSIRNFELVACINQPDEWWENKLTQEQCINNKQSIEIISNYKHFTTHVLDKSSRGKGWKGKQKGVGWARKIAMDYAANLGEPKDIIVSIDADTFYPENYLESVFKIFNSSNSPVGLANPYYHKLTNDSATNLAILRYEIYMRNYAINMLLIDNPYNFTALGSALATTVGVYIKIGGMSPKNSGEDFYFLQKLRKYGKIEQYNEVFVYPAARFSNRVNFGTGPAMIKGNNGDWSSYPIYSYDQFKQVKETYQMFPLLYSKTQETPMSIFLKKQLKRAEIWEPLRKNYKTNEQFVNACESLVDGLRILQFLKSQNTGSENEQTARLNGNLLYFNSLNKDYSFKFETVGKEIDFSNSDYLQNLRDEMANFEYYLRKLKSKV
ncbi:MAG: glycosyltransferase [Bacteroidales bacterium]|nr:glycosyltransferase [Bacteroidales bacterium]